MRTELAICLTLVFAEMARAEDFDGGGRIGDYLSAVEKQDHNHGRTEIEGVCASACTLKLAARRVCVTAEAELLFHAAHADNGQVDRLATLILLHEYPRRIRAWLIGRGALSTSAFTYMSGAQAIALGVPDCRAVAAR